MGTSNNITTDGAANSGSESYFEERSKNIMPIEELKKKLKAHDEQMLKCATFQSKSSIDPVSVDEKNTETDITKDDPEDGFVSANELLDRKVTHIPCLLDPLIVQTGLCALAGSSDTGKSSLLRQLAIAVCRGEKEFLGFKLNPRHNRAIYVSTEDNNDAMSFLLNKSDDNPHNKIDGLIFTFNTDNLLSRLEAQLSKQKVDLVVMDAFADLFSGGSDPNYVRSFLNEHGQLAQKHKCMIIFLHHTGKRAQGKQPSKHNLLGSQGFEAKMRMVIELRSDDHEPDKRHLCIVKGNYLPQEFKTESYVLKFDENLQFSNTGGRVLFQDLKNDGDKVDLKEQIKRLYDEGKTQKEIAVELKISQPTVSRALNG